MSALMQIIIFQAYLSGKHFLKSKRHGMALLTLRNHSSLSVRQLVTSILSFHHMGFRNQTQDIRFGSKYTYDPEPS